MKNIDMNSNYSELFNELKGLFESTFYTKFSDDEILLLNKDNYAKWDSLSHVKLMLCLKTKFTISLTPALIIKLTSFETIYKQLTKEI